MQRKAFRTGLSARRPAWRRALATAFIVVITASAVWLYLKSGGDRVTHTASAAHAGAGATPEPESASPVRDYRDIAQWHLFGQADPAAPAEPEHTQAPAEPDSLPVSDARISLSGVVYSPQDSATHAIIAGPDRKDKAYAIGDTLPGGAELLRVERMRIVIRRNGRLEEVPLPRSGGGMPDSRTNAGTRQPAKRPLASAASAP